MVEHNAVLVSEQITCSLCYKECYTELSAGSWNESVLLSLFRYGKVEVVEYLVQRASCRTDCKDMDGMTPLHHACR